MSSSWFSMDKLTELKGQAASVATAASTAAQAVLTDENAREDLIKKLTLNTDELISEREQIDAEETRKAEVKDKLARLLPWETYDEEREILCEECKENILKLSEDEAAFTGPFALPGQSNAEVAAKDRDSDEEEEATAGGGDDGEDASDSKKESGEDGKEDQPAAAATEKEDSSKPDLSDEAVQAAKIEAKKAKLNPLPPLLQDFDLDAHVGLIQRLFQVDPNLVEIHADLGGAGEREKTFWRNYFFHCALARYEAGLSVDEIWGDKPVAGPKQGGTTAAAAAAAAAAAEDAHASAAGAEETVTFETSSPGGHMNDAIDDVSSRHLSSTPATITMSTPSTGGAPAVAPAGPSSSQVSSASDYEMIGGGAGVGADGADDAEDMDDLEAEIARELEGLEDD